MNTKFKKYFLAIATVTIGLSSCETINLDETTNPLDISKNQLDPNFLFNNIQLEFIDYVESVAGMTSYTARLSRQFAMTSGNTYENAYAPVNFNETWTNAYADVLNDIKAIEPLAESLNLNYHLGVSKVFKAYVFTSLVDLFGNVPYSEALLGNDILNPKTDDQVSIYKAMLNELDEAIVVLNKTSSSFPPEDLYFSENGSVNATTQAKWITVANTLKLKLLNNSNLAGSDLGLNITSEINALLVSDNLIDTASEDWQFQYGNNRLNPNTRHPGYNNYYETTAGGYMSNYFMWSMIDEKGFDDPRLKYFFYRQDIDASDEDVFTLGCVDGSAPTHFSSFESIYVSGTPLPFCVADVNRGYWGRDHGDNGGIPPDDEKRTVFGRYPVGGLFDAGLGETAQEDGELGLQGAGITPIILSSFVEFIKAESALISGTSGDPAVYLENGIRHSMSKVLNFGGTVVGGATSSDVDDYVDFVMNAYNNASNQDQQLEIIMKEYHIACYGNGLEAFNNYRRTGKPSNMQPTLIPNSGDFYNSMVYPSNHVVLNSNGIQKSRKDKVFWDKNNINLH